FFFKAEDGIRDWSVTGVQTCALPIWQLARCPAPSESKTPSGLASEPTPAKGARYSLPRRASSKLPAMAATQRPVAAPTATGSPRSEERRVGKGGRTRRAQGH